MVTANMHNTIERVRPIAHPRITHSPRSTQKVQSGTRDASARPTKSRPTFFRALLAALAVGGA